MTLEGARPAEPGDAERLAELADEARAGLAGQRGGVVWALRHLRTPDRLELGRDDTHVVVGTFAGVVAGFGRVVLEPLPDGTTLGVLEGLYVEPGFRGVGVGEAIMDEVLRWCVERRCRGVDGFALPGDREAKNFFERFGLTARAILVHRALGDGAQA